MQMANINNYWQDRFLQLEGQSHQRAEQTVYELDRQYRIAQAEIEQQTAVWYSRFAVNNGITMQQAKIRLNAGELKELKWTVQEYIKYGRENAIDGRWEKELENASSRFHITRLQALQLQNQQTVEKLFGGQTDSVDALMKRTYLDSYYHTAFELHKGFGVGWDIASLDEKTLARLMTRPWAADGRNFSDRVWGSKTQLINEVQKQLTQNIMLGKSPDDAIAALSAKFNVSKNQAARLVMTESAYFASVSQQDAFNDLDVRQFQIVATLDERTSNICRDLDGEVFPMKDFEAGVSAPPFHPWCRSVTIPYFEDMVAIGERAARNDQGSVYYVPREMKYQEWHDTFVGGNKGNAQPVNPITGMMNLGSELAQKIGTQHYQAVHDILLQAENQKLAEVWKHYEDQIKVGDAHYRSGAHCSYNTIYLDIDRVAEAKNGFDAPYQTLFHEGGHAIDNLHKAGSAPYSVGYKNGAFLQTIEKEVDDLVKSVDQRLKAEFKTHGQDPDWLRQNGYIDKWTYDTVQSLGHWPFAKPTYSKSMAYATITQEVKLLPIKAMGDLSDILEGATGGRISAGVGHGKSYWQKRKIAGINVGLAKETFAEMIDSELSNKESRDTLKKYLPNTWKVFEEMIIDMVL